MATYWNIKFTEKHALVLGRMMEFWMQHQMQIHVDASAYAPPYYPITVSLHHSVSRGDISSYGSKSYMFSLADEWEVLSSEMKRFTRELVSDVTGRFADKFAEATIMEPQPGVFDADEWKKMYLGEWKKDG